LKIPISNNQNLGGGGLTAIQLMERELFARRCDITGKGMNEGFVLWDGDFYSSTEEGAIQLLKAHGFDGTLEEAYDAEICYYTEWEELDEDEAYDEDGNLVEL
jgi:hypothetical protein